MKKILSTIALSSIALTAAAQSGQTVSGVITSSHNIAGQPGARISIVGHQQTAMTDENGRFSLEVPSTDVCLVITAPGCEEQKIFLRGRDVLNLQLLAAEGEPVRTLSVTPLQGEALTTLQSGEPAAATNILVRGVNSLNLTTQPLYIVDGVVWQMEEDAETTIGGFHSNPLSLIDPADIEKVEVIRHGAAVWAAKASGGIVRITTKRAHDMVTRIEANISMGLLQKFTSMPMMSAADYKLYATDVMRGMDKTDVAHLFFTNDDPSRLSYYDTHNATDWLSAVNRNAMVQNYGINVAGGDERALYRFSLGYAQNDCNIKGASFNRLNVRFNSDINLSKRFTTASDIYYAQSNNHTPVSGIDANYSPYYLALAKSPLYGPYQHNTLGEVTNRTCDVDELNVSNPIVLIGDGLPKVTKHRFAVSLKPRYQFTDNFSLEALLAYHWDKENQDMFMPDGGIADQALLNSQGEIYATGLNEVRNLMARHSTISANVFANYDILTGWKHQLNVKVGGRIYHSMYKYTGGRGYNTGSDFMKALSNTNSNLRWIIGDNYTDRDVAWYATADYSYLQRYGVNAAFAVQASSRYGNNADGGFSIAGTQWMPTAHIEAYWNLSAERFMAGLKGVDAKVRLGWEQTGNDQLPINASRTYLHSSALSQNAVGNVIANIGNTQLKWETTRRVNAGLDLAFFGGRWDLTFDYYNGTTSDLISHRSLAQETGLAYYWANGGEMKNSGFEFSTTARIIDTRNWKFSASASLGHYTNEITALPEGSFTTDFCGARLLTEVGRPAGVFYGFQTAGVLSTASEASAAGLGIVAANGDVLPFQAGDVHFVDQNGDHIINDLDRVVIGDATPDLYGSFGLNLEWRHFSIAPLFSFVCGGDIYNALRADLESGSTMHNQTTAMLSRWTADGQQTTMPRASYGDPMGNARFSDRWIEDGSYLRMKSLTVAYDIPFRTAMLQNIRIWASVDNVFTLTRYLGADPEMAYSGSLFARGIDAGRIPQTRSFLFGVKVNL